MNTAQLFSIFSFLGAAKSLQEALYTTPGTYTFIVPDGVTSISAVLVGGGGRGALRNAGVTGGGGGGGGALAWQNNISVTPGQQFTVVVGGVGQSSTFNGVTAGGGGNASGGSGGAGGTRSGGGGGGNGGAGGSGSTRVFNGVTYYPNGPGGGAGGYAGNGGGDTQNGLGGGGGGGARINDTESLDFERAGFGGSVGVYGQGASGAAGSNGPINGNPGSVPPSPFNLRIYGGGGRGIFVSGENSEAISGAVRIIWPGNTRLFPATNVGAV